MVAIASMNVVLVGNTVYGAEAAATDFGYGGNDFGVYHGGISEKDSMSKAVSKSGKTTEEGTFGAKAAHMCKMDKVSGFDKVKDS